MDESLKGKISTVAVLDPKDLDDKLEQKHRDAMLDLVMAWGTLDAALGLLLARLMGVSEAEGAELIGKMRGSAKFAEIRKIVQDAPGSGNAVAFLKENKKTYEKHSFARNRIAHSHCLGVWTKDRNYVMFAAYEKVGEDRLAFDAIPIEQMQEAAQWGIAMAALAVKLSEAAADAPKQAAPA